ncbi:adenylate kinase [Anatilimnocola floriformis]|uniref:adenylate kinase n=1 Tax=Anatilimnocola floriformis TaxID=2948575 RepID=UPI0020C390AE|nr:adenylate kinase [Anatilimnocola floriformis]
MLIVFIGPPGAGKGTASRKLLDYLQIPHLSTGELLRAAKQSSPLGRLAAQYMDRGQLVPDPIVLSMVGEELDKPAFSRGCMFDGFPRTIQQAKSLDDSLRQRGTPLSIVIELKADEAELITRMLRRAATEKRVDDTPETIGRRMEVYHRQTSPLLDYYRKQGLLVSVDAMGSPDDVFELIRAAVDKKKVTVESAAG